MIKAAPRSKMLTGDEAFGPSQDDALPLKWSIAVWLLLAAVSWGGIYYAFSLIL